MNKEQYNILYKSGWGGVLAHYGHKLLKKEITREKYDEALLFWSNQFDKKKTTIIKKEKASQGSETGYDEDIINKLCSEFGMNNTGETIIDKELNK